LEGDIHKLIRECKRRRMRPAVRLNGTSDIPKLAHTLAAKFPQVQFYDYTKIPRVWERTRDNYHLTFSHSGENLSDCFGALRNGVNVAVVFAGELPQMWNGYRGVDGDRDDLRFLDPAGVVVGLKAKGEAKRMMSIADSTPNAGIGTLTANQWRQLTRDAVASEFLRAEKQHNRIGLDP
jgi:hypothetical protein